VDFYKRNDRSALVLPPKVADMQASAAMNKSVGAVNLSPFGKGGDGGQQGSIRKP
jgi:protein phosphatase methylesterase 1